MSVLAGIFRAIVRVALWLMFITAVAFLAAGAFSYWHGIPDNAIWIGHLDTQRRWQAAMVKGTLHVVYSEPLARGQRIAKSEKKFGPFYFKANQIGIVYAQGGGLPFWSPAVLLLILPAAALTAGPLRRRRRRKRGECLKCGYNLTGLPEPRCPECGTPFAASSSATGSTLAS